MHGNQAKLLREAQAKSQTAEVLSHGADEMQSEAQRQAADLAAQVGRLQRQAADSRVRLETAAQQLSQANSASSLEQVTQGRTVGAGLALGARPQVRSQVQPSDAGCGGTSTSGLSNGVLPDSALCPLVVGNGQRLRPDAAAAFDALYAAGGPCITDSYRSHAAQVDLYSRKPALAAVPGTSNHGW